MTTFVLVHGAWHGGWCWSRVRRLLTTRGHEVFTPTLTFLGERSHLLDRSVGLETHVLDVANVMIWEDLKDVVLVGHSYAGLVVGQVADRMPERVASLVYLDAHLPEDGKSLANALSDHGELDRRMAQVHGDGWKVPPRSASLFGVNADDVDWVDGKCTMHPLSCFESAAQIGGACHAISNIGFIAAHGKSRSLSTFYEEAGARGWWREVLPCGHDIMIDMPDELVAVLCEKCSSEHAVHRRGYRHEPT